jgi:enoyl-[acyl-carrier protein] reductase I
MSPNVRKGKAYHDLNYDWLQKTYDISAVSFHKMMQTADKMDVMNQYGSILGLSYIAAQRTYPFYNDMADAKALLESIARNYGSRLAHRGIRVNTISQAPTKTSAGSGIKGFDGMYTFADKIAPMGNPSADECADYCIAMFSDLTRKVTMQNLYHDGGFVTNGISEEMMDDLAKLYSEDEE